MPTNLYIVGMNRLQRFIAAPATAPKSAHAAAAKTARQPA